MNVTMATGWAAIAIAAMGITPAEAQTQPDAGAILQQSREQDRVLPELPPAVQPRLMTDTGIRVRVTRFQVEGATRFDPATLARQLDPLVGKELGFQQLQAAADRVAAYYRRRGVHAAVLLPEQDLTGGTVRLLVVEGRLGRIRIEGDAKRPPRALIEAMIRDGQSAGAIIDTRRLERATLLANDLPGVKVSTILDAGAKPGETDVIARLDSRPVLSGAIGLDNRDARATGMEQATVSLLLSNPTGQGDDLQFAVSGTRGKRYVRGAYGAPVGTSGLRASVNASLLRYKLVGEFAATGARGEAKTVGARLGLPLVRSTTGNLAAAVTYDHRKLTNDSDFGNLSRKTIDAVAFSFNADATDRLNGGGATIANVQLVTGRLDLDGNPIDLFFDQLGFRRNGRYTKATVTLGRLQRVSNKTALWVSLSAQAAGKNLDSSEKFFLGGANGVRAYPALEGSGDDGWLATTEFRLRATDTLQLSAFYDHGRIRRDHDPIAPLPAFYQRLEGVGLGADWRLGRIGSLEGSVAWRLGRNAGADPVTRADSDGSRRTPQVWLALNIPFSS